MNCFLGNTSYGNQFVSSGMAQKMQEIRPPNNNLVSHKFRAVSSYKTQFGGNAEQSVGRVLQEKTQEQRSRSRDIAMNQRRGTYASQNTRKFNGESMSKTAHEQAANLAVSQLKTGTSRYRPVDTLFCAGKSIRSLGQSQHRRAHNAQAVEKRRFAVNKPKPIF